MGGRTEEGAHQREHVREERDDLRNNERNHPIHNNDAHPRAPPLHRVAVAVVRVLEDAEEQEARRHAPVERPEEDDGWDGERERDLLVHWLQAAERWCSHVLVAWTARESQDHSEIVRRQAYRRSGTSKHRIA